MARRHFAVVVLVWLCGAHASHGQKGWSNDPIQVTVGRKLIFHQGQEERNMRDMMRIVSYDPEAYKLMSSAKGHKDLRNFCRIGGTILMAIPIGMWLGEGDPIWAFMGGGVLLWGASFPLHGAYEKRAAHAAQMHNANLVERKKKAALNIGVNPVMVRHQGVVPLLGPSIQLRW